MKRFIKVMATLFVLMASIGIINVVSVDAARVYVGETLSGVMGIGEEIEYTLTVDRDMKVKFEISSIEAIDVDEDDSYYYETLGFEVECDDYYYYTNQEEEIDYKAIGTGEEFSKTIELKKGKKYTVSLDGSFNDYDITYEVSLKDVSKYTKNIKLNKKELNLYSGKTYQLTAKPSPKSRYLKRVTWKSTNKKVATVDENGKVTTKKEGKCYITANVPGGKKTKCKVVVTDYYTKKIKLNDTSIKLVADKKFKLKASPGEKGKHLQKVTWKSTNNKVATVNSSGKVTAKNKGKCYITASVPGGKKVKCKVTVESKYAKNIKLNRTSLKMYTKSTYRIKAISKEKGKKAGNIVWKTTNVAVATVDQTGKVTVRGAGACYITAKPEDGKTVMCKVVGVKRPELYITEMGFYTNSVGGIEPYFYIENNTGKTIKYIYTTAYFYNAVGDPAYCEIWDANYRDLRMIGPLKSGKKDSYYYDPVIYNGTTTYMKIKTMKVEFTDGTTKTYTINKTIKD